MSRRALLLLLLASGCNDAPVRLSVDLSTDLVPGTDFALVRTTLDGGRSVVTAAPPGEEDGRLHVFRVADLEGLSPGTYLVEVQALDADAVEVARGGVRVSLREDLVVPVFIRASCLGVRCPPELVCADGACVEPPCPPGDESCGGGCSDDGDCAVSHECLRGACEAGACITAADDTRCQPDERCDVSAGCVSDAPDAGGGVDAGRPPDPPDAGPSCDPASCGAGEGCCPGVAGCVDLTTNARCGACDRACPSDQRCLHDPDMGIDPYCTRCDPAACGAFGAICCPATAPAETCTAWFSDPANCGGCGRACPGGQNCVTHGEPVFTGAFCTSCSPSDCAAFGVGCCPDSAPGPECTNWFTDPNNCGGCNVRCPSGQNCVFHAEPDVVGPFCTTCDPDACAAFGVGCCPDSAPGPDCTNWFTDPNNCGGCGRRCPAGQTCSSGTCG